MKKIINICLRLILLPVIILYLLLFMIIQAIYWIITGKEEKNTKRLAEYLTDKIEEL